VLFRSLKSLQSDRAVIYAPPSSRKCRSCSFFERTWEVRLYSASTPNSELENVLRDRS